MQEPCELAPLRLGHAGTLALGCAPADDLQRGYGLVRERLKHGYLSAPGELAIDRIIGIEEPHYSTVAIDEGHEEK